MNWIPQGHQRHEIAEVESMTDTEMAGIAANRKCTYMAATAASAANDTQSRSHILLRLLRTVRRLVPAQAVNSLHCIAPLKVIQSSLRTSCPQTVILINISRTIHSAIWSTVSLPPAFICAVLFSSSSKKVGVECLLEVLLLPPRRSLNITSASLSKFAGLSRP